MQTSIWRNKTLILLFLGIVIIFAGRAFLATELTVPNTFHLFDIMTVSGSLFVLGRGYRDLRRRDWLLALLLGLVIGVSMLFSTLFSPYPYLGVVRSTIGQALLRGAFTTVAVLGGLIIARWGGPVQLHVADGKWRQAGFGILIGLAVGLPLAILNVFALQFTQGQAIAWQDPLAAMLDALQPGIFEEVIYRFALWGLLWLMLRNSISKQSDWISGLLAMLVHNYSHFDDLFLQSPLVAVGMGAILALFWGLPPVILARRRGLESAIAFHWFQDMARFLL